MSGDESIWRTPSNQEWAEGKAWARQFVSRRRELERLARREWIEDISRRLGLVAEVHPCQVYRCRPGDWGWWCRRGHCGMMSHFLPSQAEAVTAALEHTRAFVPEPLGEAPVTELDLLAFDAFWAGMRAEQDAFAARLPDRIADVTELINERFAGELPGGMRFEWEPIADE